jgi:hypothetical protein
MAKKKTDKTTAPGFNKNQLQKAEKNLNRLKELDERILEVGEGQLTATERTELKKLRKWREEYGRKLTKR